MCAFLSLSLLPPSFYSKFVFHFFQAPFAPASSLFQHQQVAGKSTAASAAINKKKTYDTTGRDAYSISRTAQGPAACVEAGIAALGITQPTTLYRNLTYQQLYEHEQRNKEGVVAHAAYGDTFTVDTGKYTGRSPKDRWIVLNEGSESAAHIDWNSINMATSPEVFDELYDKAVKHFNTRETAYVFDGYCGASLETRKKIRFIHEMAWQQHFGTYCSTVVVSLVTFTTSKQKTKPCDRSCMHAAVAADAAIA